VRSDAAVPESDQLDRDLVLDTCQTRSPDWCRCLGRISLDRVVPGMLPNYLLLRSRYDLR
jgi:hypothetical protein